MKLKETSWITVHIPSVHSGQFQKMFIGLTVPEFSRCMGPICLCVLIYILNEPSITTWSTSWLTFDRHLDRYFQSISQSTLNPDLIDSQSIVGRVSTNLYILMDNAKLKPRCQSGVDWVLSASQAWIEGKIWLINTQQQMLIVYNQSVNQRLF